MTSVVNYNYLGNSSLLSGYTANAGGSAASLTVSKTYESQRNLIDAVTNSVIGGANAGVVSAFDYTNDEVGRRTRRDDLRVGGTTSPQSTYWSYAYNNRNEVIGGNRFRTSDDAPIPGMQFGYGYDNIGNRIYAEDGDPENKELYTANNLNQYQQRNTPPTINVFGTAATNATVSVGLRTAGVPPAPYGEVDIATIQQATRDGDYFHLMYPVDNLSGPFSGTLDITAVINPAGHADLDIVTNETRSVFKPQSPEQFVYDDDGNLLDDGRFNYTWNAENRLIEVQSRTGILPVIHAEYAYDYQGRRFSKTVDGAETSFIWDGNHIV